MAFTFILVPSAVFCRIQNIVNGAPHLMNSSSIHYLVKANLHPAQVLSLLSSAFMLSSEKMKMI